MLLIILNAWPTVEADLEATALNLIGIEKIIV